MEKIGNLKQLADQKKKMSERQKELESLIRTDWQHLEEMVYGTKKADSFKSNPFLNTIISGMTNSIMLNLYYKIQKKFREGLFKKRQM